MCGHGTFTDRKTMEFEKAISGLMIFVFIAVIILEFALGHIPDEDE
jgi:hypothetical protein